MESIIRVGNQVFIRTVTNYAVGKIERVGKRRILLSGASWVASTGRFSDCLSRGVFEEVEVIPGGMMEVAHGAIVDAFLWPHPLPKVTK